MVKYQKQVPEYYKGMYQDGYTPEQILDAIHRKMYRQAIEKESQVDEIAALQINSVVRIQK